MRSSSLRSRARGRASTSTTPQRAWHAYLGLSLLLGVLGCDEVDHCKKGARRCLGGRCEARECDFDLVCAVRISDSLELCGKNLGDGRFDFGDRGKDDAAPVDPVPLDCECEGDALCSGDTGQCVNYCERVEPLPGTGMPPEVIFCEHFEGDPPFSFEEICKRQCRVQCQRWAQFCDFTCAADYCDSQPVQDACAQTCPAAQGGRELCLTLACNATRDQTCASVSCPAAGQVGDCQDVTCRDTCGPGGSGVWVGDGKCDDGDLYSSVTAECEWGSDCIDCGPRTGPAPLPQPNGGVCAYHSGCQGHSPVLADNRAWCLRLDAVQQGLARCVPDCSQGARCASGYECRTAKNDDGMPITDGDIEGRACYPLICGG